MYKLYKLLTIALLSLVCFVNVLSAQDVGVELSVRPVQVEANALFYLSLAVKNADIKNPAAIVFPSWITVSSGPSSSISQSFVLSNGSMDKSVIHTLTWAVQTSRLGRLTIGPISVGTNKGTLKSNSTVLEVVKKGKLNSNNQQQQQQSQSKVINPFQMMEDLFGNAIPNFQSREEYLSLRPKLDQRLYSDASSPEKEAIFYVGQQLVLDSYVISPQPQAHWTVMPASQEYTSQFSKNDYYFMNDATYSLFSQQGRIYSNDLKARLVFSLGKPGQYTIPKMFYAYGRLYHDPHAGEVVDGYDRLVSDAISFKIKNLPNVDVPENFSRAIGRFTIKATLDKSAIDIGNSALLNVEIAGNGNLQGVLPPEFKIEGMDHLLSKADEILEDNKVINKRVYHYSLLPHDGGDYSIDNITFSYFDPYEHNYKTIHASPLGLKVTGTYQEPTKAAGGKIKTAFADIKRHVNLDILSPAELLSSDRSQYIFGYIGILALLFCFSVITSFRKSYKKGNIEKIKQDSSYRTALKELSQLKRSNNREKESFTRIDKIFSTYLSSKLIIGGQNPIVSTIETTLRNKQVHEETIKMLCDFITYVRSAGYAPIGNLNSNSHLGTNELFSKAQTILKNLNHAL